MKKRLSMVLAIIMVLSLFMLNTGAESAFASAKLLDFGKTRTYYLENGDKNYVKINAPSNGKIKITLTSYTKQVWMHVYNSDGNEIIKNKEEVSIGEWGSWDVGDLLWNDISETAKGTRVYNVKKGSSYIAIDNGDSGIPGDCSIKITFIPNKDAVDAVLNVTLEKGETLQLGAALTPSDSTSKVSWKSSDTEIAKVSSSGKITAVGKGTATITATVNGMKFYLGVKVREK